jgi:hypothetical protein
MSLDKLLEKAKEYNLSKEIIDSRESGRIEFVSKFPIDQIGKLQIDEYVAGTDKNSFSYWLEFKKILFGIGGGNASKFGLYKGADGNYYGGTGQNKILLKGKEIEKQFEIIKTGIIKALDYVKNDRISEIKALNIPIWNMVLQKILTLYFPDKFITIGASDVLIECAKDISLDGIELIPENLIQINYECKKKLDSQAFLKDWSYEKIGSLIWETYYDDSKRDFYILGSKYGENNNVDVFPDMLANSVISVGFASKYDLTEYFQAKPVDIAEFLEKKGEEQKSINALKHFLSLKVGDRIAIKASGSPKGTKGFLSIVGIAEVIEKDGKIYEHDPKGLGHIINVTYLNAPVYKEFELGGYGSTMHKLTKPDQIDLIFKGEYATAPISGNDFNSILTKFEKSDLDFYFNFLRTLIKHFDMHSGDERLVFSIRDNNLNFTIGQRYCWNLFVTHKKGKFGVISTDKLKENSGRFDGTDPAPYYTHFDEINSVYENSKSIYSSLELELKRTKKSSFRKFNNTEFENFVFTPEQTKNNNQMNFPLNTILYGPPGTGKTYNTILRSAEIVENRKIDSYDEALKIFKDNLHNRIEFITFHQNYSYEDFIQGLRPETDNKSSLTFDKKDGVFKKIADKALENIKLSEKAPEELSNEALFDNALEKFKEVVEENDANYPINETAYIMEVEEDAFRYTGEKWTNHANGLRMKFSDLKEFYKNGVKSRKDVKNLSNISGLAGQHATYYFLVYEKIIKLLPKKIDAPLKVERKNYVIVIDEINRANISRVFGELITLIEPDKRSHGEIPLEAKLPSGDYFIVPSNLYIIGTMNTADKSIALLDIALRRRFEFESMYPLYEIKGSEIYDKDILLKINEQIIKSKGHDFQIGHAYFMGENKDLIQRMNKKVIPLLLEYFMNDEKEVKGILFNAGLQVEENSWPIKIIGKRA